MQLAIEDATVAVAENERNVEFFGRPRTFHMRGLLRFAEEVPRMFLTTVYSTVLYQGTKIFTTTI